MVGKRQQSTFFTYSTWIYSISCCILMPAVCFGDNQALFHIKNCMLTIKQPGTYQISGNNFRRTWGHTATQCQLFIIAPPMRNVRLTFRSVNVDCENSGVMIQDGLTTLSRNRGGRDFLPQDVSAEKRKFYLCSENAQAFDSMTLSQNYGQIFYKLRHGEFITFDVDFIPANDICDALMTAEENPHSYVLRANGVGSCRVYISGSGRLKVTEFHLDSSENDAEMAAPSLTNCGSENASSLSLQVNSTSWKPLPLSKRILNCKYSFSDVIIPCQFNILELRNSGEGVQYAMFTLDELSDRYKEPWSALCY